MTVGELLHRCSSAELTEWMAYEQITGPLGPERDDVLMAILAATIANTGRGKGRRARPRDFLPTWDRGRRVMGWQDMLAAVRGINRRLGGTDATTGHHEDTQEEGVGHGHAGRADGAAGHQRRRPDRWRERRR